MTNDGKRFCYYITEAMTQRHDDGTVHYYPAIVTENEDGYKRTDWDYGTDFKLAQETVISLNAERGISQPEAMEIVASSMFPKSRK
jgi:hypothetical protein